MSTWWIRLFCSFLLTATAALAQQRTEPPITRAELLRLRPVVEKDLKTLLKRFDNSTSIPAKELHDEFEQCRFTPLHLDGIGRAILVEANAGHGANANSAMMDIYVSDHSTFRRIVDAVGFGPAIYDRPGSPPDLVFGWASGVCYATYYRYRYEQGNYVTDACNQEYRENGDVTEQCPVKACEGSHALPTFAPSWPVQADETTNSGATTSTHFPFTPSLTGKEILNGKSNESRPQ